MVGTRIDYGAPQEPQLQGCPGHITPAQPRTGVVVSSYQGGQQGRKHCDPPRGDHLDGPQMDAKENYHRARDAAEIVIRLDKEADSPGEEGVRRRGHRKPAGSGARKRRERSTRTDGPKETLTRPYLKEETNNRGSRPGQLQEDRPRRNR